MPLVALFTGARRTELAQLKIGDLRKSVEGVWFINADGLGGSVKNQGSIRSVPLHKQLMALGMLDY